ncbi:MAG: DNA repair protein RecO [Flavisolibacter sp.]|jgi:DNA repair protein RecO (recombination protein O)|nr:DNA repair protein RecO [Flavisolibacter sp.]
MVNKTRGIVLRTVKYGETSLVVTIFTELFGLQSYMVNGVRSSSKRGSNKAAFFQPVSLLDLVAYHNELKNLQRLKEYKWNFLYRHIFSDVKKHSVALFMIELLTRCLKQPEPHPELFYFTEDALAHLDDAEDTVTANFPLFFAVHLAVFFGFRITDNYTLSRNFLDLEEGVFVSEQPLHSNYVADSEAASVSHILKIMQPSELKDVVLKQEQRRRLIQVIEKYYALHIQDFGNLKTLPVLREVLG